ncbi:DEKNAAC102877 [Brettanomyces naardenensis]|uniref:DEKNAAC102877 n=1 Tax=Brettanomyces naardenensis TaxID=13370 RepID=A0A448YM03_BRENA|nr:DEKNAAC102877 [Brettanomyces naardenensis]
MSVESNLKPIFAEVDNLKGNFIDRLRHAVEIPSVSGDETLRPSVVKMGEFLKSELERLGADEVQLKQLGTQPEPVAVKDLPLPPVVVSRFGKDPSKKTVLVYGHYDVQPAAKDDGWDTEPFELIEKDDKLLGRGSTDDKGPVIGWLNVLEAHKKAGIELPVNFITCFEGMEESGSIGLDKLIHDEADKFFKGVDVVCICDNYWLGTRKPVLTYGLRGVNYYQISIEGPSADLHSGIFGGIVHEPMTDLVKIMSQLVDGDGKILIPGVAEMVAPVTEKESKLYDDIDYDAGELAKATGAEEISIYSDKKDILMHRWRYPSLSLHGIEGAFSGAGAKTVIPAKVSGKFSIRTVPNITSEELTKFVVDYLKKKFDELHSPNKFSAGLVHDGDYWLSDPFNDAFTAAKEATKLVWGVEPDFIREGGSIPITITFEKELKTKAVLLPMGRGDDGAHSINEKLNLANYIGGIKTMSAYLHYLGK